MLTYVTSGLSQVITWVSTVLGELLDTGGDLAALAPLMVIGISISVIFLTVKIVKSLVWGM